MDDDPLAIPKWQTGLESTPSFRLVVEADPANNFPTGLDVHVHATITRDYEEHTNSLLVELEHPVAGVGSAVIISTINPVGGILLPSKLKKRWWDQARGGSETEPVVQEPRSTDWRTGKWARGRLIGLYDYTLTVYVYNVPFDATLTAATLRLKTAGMNTEYKQMLCDMLDMCARGLRNNIQLNLRRIVYVDKSISGVTERDDDALVRYVSSGSTYEVKQDARAFSMPKTFNCQHIFDNVLSALMQNIQGSQLGFDNKYSGGKLGLFLEHYRITWAFDRNELEGYESPTEVPETINAWRSQSMIGLLGNLPDGTYRESNSVFLAYSRFLAAVPTLPFEEIWKHYPQTTYFVYSPEFMSHIVTIITQRTIMFKADKMRISGTGRLEYDPEPTAPSVTQTVAEICKCLSKFLPDPNAVREFSSVLDGLQLLHDEKFSQSEGRGRPISWKSTYMTWLDRGLGESVGGYLTVKWPWVEKLVDHVMSLQRDHFRAQIRGFNDVTVM